MLPDLGRLILPLCATVAATVALRVTLGRWRPTLAVLGSAAALGWLASRSLRQRRPVAPDDWPAAGRPTLALATGHGVWRVELASGRAFPASQCEEPTADVEPERCRAFSIGPTGQPAVDVEPDAGRWRAGGRPAGRGGSDRGTRPRWRRPVGWRQPDLPAAASAAGLPRRGDRVLALMPDGRGGDYLATAPWPAALAMRAYLAAPSGRLGGARTSPSVPARLSVLVWTGIAAPLASRLLAPRWGRLYHLDASGTRRLIAAGLPPVFAIASAPTEGALAGPPPRTDNGPRPLGPEPPIVRADLAAH